MLDVINTISFPSAMSESRSPGRRTRGSARRRWISRYFGRFAMFAESEMIAAMKGRPSVVLPSVCSWMRGLDFESAVKYATTCDHAGSFRSAPGVNPITDAGVGMGDGVCAPANDGIASAATIAARRRSSIKRSDVDLAKLVGGL